MSKMNTKPAPDKIKSKIRTSTVMASSASKGLLSKGSPKISAKAKR